MLDALDGALDVAARESRDRELGQSSLFGALEEHAPAFTPHLRTLPAPLDDAALTWEKETLGIFVSGHPLADVAEALARTGAIADQGPARGSKTTHRRRSPASSRACAAR